MSHVDQPTHTTRTDVVNAYPSILQTSSYMFMETNTTPPTCIAVVKPHFVFKKNAGQHAADFNMISESNLGGTTNRHVECVRVDGASDEGPSHAEVQLMWSERHLQKEHAFTIVATRYSGGSYLNKVELLNGCIAQAHSSHQH